MHSIQKKRDIFDKYYFGSERTNFQGGFIAKIQTLVFSFEERVNQDELAEKIFKELEWLLSSYDTIDFSDFDDDPDYKWFLKLNGCWICLPVKCGFISTNLNPTWVKGVKSERISLPL